jgi:hypothetical protein
MRWLRLCEPLVEGCKAVRLKIIFSRARFAPGACYSIGFRRTGQYLLQNRFFMRGFVPVFQSKTGSGCRLTWVPFLPLVLLAATMAVGKTVAGTGPRTCDFSGEASRDVTTRINNLDIRGAELEFPEDYVFSRPFADGKERDGLLLRANVYDFSSYSHADSYLESGRSKISSGIRDYLQILIGSFVPMAVIWQRTLANKHKVFGYDEADAKPLRVKNAGHGLLAPSGYLADGFLKDDIFFQRDDAGVTDIIVCSEMGRVPNPSCRHTFEAGAYDVKITYGRNELPRWQELRDGTEALLQCFTTKTPEQVP